jgi:TRAP transporter TAXI family solute receptor
MNLKHRHFWLIALLGTATLLPGPWLAGQSGAKPVVRFLIGSAGAFNQLGFVQEYARALPNIDLVVVDSTRDTGRLEELQRAEADLVINASQAAFLAYSGQRETTERFDRLRAIAALGVAPLHLVARSGSGIRSVLDLRGRPVSLGIPNGEAQRAATAVLNAFGVDLKSVDGKSLSAEAAAAQLADGRVHAMFTVSGYPAEAVRRATTGGRAYLVPIEGPPADRLRAKSGFLFPALVPAGTYPSQAISIRTVGTQNMLVTRRDLDEQIVYELTKQFFAALPKLAALVGTIRQMDVHRASATSIPLHDGAARYYRERELFR